jgi:DNA mismatch repair protein MutL
MFHDRQIRLLPPELQNQIAAGEVVERPASVLKEIIENSLDAGATRIRIQIRDGGQSFIKISDNGCGIPEDQLELAVTRHATSKLASLGDLQRIQSYGFRGEALPSIASVSRFRLASALSDGDGAMLELLHGRVLRAARTAMPKGTEIEIGDLFANVPARLKFLKQPATEARKCADLVARVALANLAVDFEFISAERTVYRFLADESLAQRLGAMWPGEVVESMIDVFLDDGALSVRGLVGDPAQAQARPDRILIYVNGRPVQDRTVLSALREAYRGRILGKEYPQAVLFLRIPPDEVDVNVHPAKTEVRFQDDSMIFRAVRKAVLNGLERHSRQPGEALMPPLAVAQTRPTLPMPQPGRVGVPAAEPAPMPANGAHEHAWTQKFASSAAAQRLFESRPDDYAPPSPAPHAPHPSPTRQHQEGVRYLGQFANTYLMLASEDEITLIDQHAAHERVLFNVLRAQGTRGDRRPLLLPLEMPLHPAQSALVQDIWTELDGLGFSLELAPGPRLLLRAVPALLSPAKAREFMDDMLASKARSMEDLWAVMACKAAVKAGDELGADEALALVDSWRKLPDRDYCPHGRPVAVRWRVGELEKLFKRRS